MGDAELPKGWDVAKLDKIVSSSGVISDGDWVESKDQDPSGPIRLIQLADIGDGEFIDKSSRFMNEDAATRLNCSYLSETDVLIARMPDPLGRACLLPKQPYKSVTVVDVCLIRLDRNAALLPIIMMHWINSPAIRNDIRIQATGTTRKRITRKKLAAFDFPIPPLPEQTRIANRLDELLAQVNTIKARVDTIPAIVKRFRQSVLAAAVSGRLTEVWRSENRPIESSMELKKRWIEERRSTFHEQQIILVQNGKQRRAKKFKMPIQPDTDFSVQDIPDAWTLISVSEFADCLDSQRVPVKKELRVSSKGLYPYFGANGEVDRVDEYLFDCDLVLVTEDETFYGRVKPIAYRYSGKCWVNNHVHALSAPNKIANDFLCFALMYYDVIPWLTGTTGRAKLTQGALTSLPVGLPPEVEQKEIVKRVESLFAFADQIEQRVADAQARINQLTQSILAKAFRGELVPQDPNDEPASVLLERIRQEREAAATLVKAVKKRRKPA